MMIQKLLELTMEWARRRGHNGFGWFVYSIWWQREMTSLGIPAKVFYVIKGGAE